MSSPADDDAKDSAAPAAPVSAALSAIERVRLARNPSRPQTLDYVEHLLHDFFEIHGDRRFADDGAIVAGLGYFGRRRSRSSAISAAAPPQERIKRNFGKPHPEGYRKAARMYDLASRMGLPLITFIDTQGAEPGFGAEERGQAEAIAANLELMMRLEVPVIACVIGEGGSGGALALGVANVDPDAGERLLFGDHARGMRGDSVARGGPERVADAAAALKLSAPDLLRLGVADEIVPEPPGGAHQDPPRAARELGRAIERHLVRLSRLSPIRLRREREKKFAAMGSAFVSARRVENQRPLG